MDSDSGFGFWIPDSLTRVAEKVEMDSDSDSLLVEAVFGQMDSQIGFGFGVRCFKNMFVDENLQYRGVPTASVVVRQISKIKIVQG